MRASQAGETSATDKLDVSVWQPAFQQSFAAWSAARHAEKAQHMLVGPLLARAEQHLLTSPKSFSDEEKRFIVTSLSRATVAAARRRVLEDGAPDKPPIKFKWIATFVIIGIGWLSLPELMRHGIDRAFDGQARAVSGSQRQSAATQKKPVFEMTASGGLRRRPAEAEPDTAQSITAAEQQQRPVAAAVPTPVPSRAPRIDDGRILRQRIDELAGLARDRFDKGDRRTSLMLSLEAIHRASATKQEAQSLEATMTAVAALYESMAKQTASIPELGGTHSAPVLAACREIDAKSEAPGHLTRMLATAARRLASASGAVIDARCRQYVEPVEDYAISVRDIATGRHQVRLHGHEGDVLATAFNADGGRILSGSADRTARLWDAATGRAIAVLAGHDEMVTTVAFSPDGRIAATASADRTVRLWDAASGRALRTLSRHFGNVTSVRFSSDNRRLASVSVDGFARLWDLAGEAPPVLLRMEGSSVVAAGFSRDGRRVFTLAHGGTAQVWDTVTGTALAHVRNAKSPFGAVDLSHDGRWLLTTAWNGMVAIWSAETGTLGAALTGAGRDIQHAAFDATGSRVTLVEADGTVLSVPFFATITEAAQHARDQAGLCLEGAERQALGLTADIPGWCLLGRLPDLDRSLVLAAPVQVMVASERVPGRTAVRN